MFDVRSRTLSSSERTHQGILSIVSNNRKMSKKGSSYENMYTQQINDALGAQHGYENKKQAEKAKLREETQTFRYALRVFGFLAIAAVLGLCAYLINLDPANSGPLAIGLAVFLVVAAIIWFVNR